MSSSNLPRLALVALQYPPIGGGYSERMTGFVKQWVSMGMEVHVVTAEVEGLGLPLDNEAVQDVTGVKSVTRLPTLKSSKVFGSRGLASLFWRLANKLLPVDGHLLWSFSALKVAEKLYRDNKVDVILTTSTPYSVHVAGLFFKWRNEEFPWVADFRDPWTTNHQESTKRRTYGSYALESWLEQAVYKKSDGIVINTNLNVQDLQEKFALDLSKVSVIQNGFDPDTPISGTPCLVKRDGVFRLGYFGGIRGDWYEGPLYKGLAHLKSVSPEQYEALEVLLIGSSGVKGDLPEELSIVDKLEPCGFFPRSELGGWFSSVDALLLILPDNDGQEIGWVPQKLYLYLQSGLPILAIAPKGEAASYIEMTDRGVVVSPLRPEEFANVITKWVKEGVGNMAEVASIERFSKVTLSMKFLGIFREVCDLEQNRRAL